MKSFTISGRESNQFCRLSGDFNPLHVDPVAARRLVFGSVVLHGLHVFLRGLDHVLADFDKSMKISHLKAQFSLPARPGDCIEVRGEPFIGGQGKFVMRCNGRVIQTIKLSISEQQSPANSAVVDSLVSDTVCEENDLTTLEGKQGEVTLKCHSATLYKLFPAVGRILPDIQIAVLLATTFIVGMKAPGLHSVFTYLDIDFDQSPGEQHSNVLTYKVGEIDTRFSIVPVSVYGPFLSGKLQALLRPPPVDQPPFAAFRELVDPEEFIEQRVLVVGGSRGLGEVAAKIIAAGAGDVRISYCTGREDAMRVSADISAGGGKCSPLFFNVLAPRLDPLIDELGAWKPTHLHYFATPNIDITQPGEWNDELFNKFCEYYVSAFHRTVTKIADLCEPSVPLTLIFPSTAFLTNPEPGAEEYSAAKAAGESLCRGLHASAGIRCHIVRLPRLDTDQTNGFYSVEDRPATMTTIYDALSNNL